MKKCRLCQKEGKLTLEHIPPKQALNNHQMKMTRGKDTLDILIGDKEFSEVDGFHQKGRTFKTLCMSCNNFLGSEYVPEYIRLVVNLVESFRREGKNPEPNTYYFIELPIKPLNLLKQILSMFCSVVSEGFNEQLDFKDFILEKEKKGDFSKKFKVGMYGFVGDHAVIGGPAVQVNIKGGKPHTVSNIEHYPLGFMLVDKDYCFPKGVLDLEDLKNFDYDQKETLHFEFEILDQMGPLDFFRNLNENP